MLRDKFTGGQRSWTHEIQQVREEIAVPINGQSSVFVRRVVYATLEVGVEVCTLWKSVLCGVEITASNVEANDNRSFVVGMLTIARSLHVLNQLALVRTRCVRYFCDIVI